jgi:hypothetical protein
VRPHDLAKTRKSKNGGIKYLGRGCTTYTVTLVKVGSCEL